MQAIKKAKLGKVQSSTGVTWNPKIIRAAKAKDSSNEEAADVAEAERRLSDDKDRIVPFNRSK
jgi:transaldolase